MNFVGRREGSPDRRCVVPVKHGRNQTAGTGHDRPRAVLWDVEQNDRFRLILLKNSVAVFAAAPRRKSTSQIDPGSTIAAQGMV
jgi:hypothetical protein